MASLTGGFAPIAGASAKVTGSSNAKKTDLTGGLISLGSGSSSARAKSDDVDFSDFDVDDLLLGDAAPKDKGRDTSKSPASPHKKKKSSSSNGKKKKDKKKSNSALDLVGEDDDDWDQSDGLRSKVKDDGFDEIVPVKKNTRLDDEFARMLGLEDEVAAFGSTANDEHDTIGPMDSPVERNMQNTPLTAAGPLPNAESHSPTQRAGSGGGLDASFFQDDAPSNNTKDSGADDGYSFLSSLGSLGERRGARGGGRRAGGVVSDSTTKSIFADPFGATTEVSQRASGLDDLFSSSSARGTTRSEPQTTKSTFATLFNGNEGTDRKIADKAAEKFNAVVPPSKAIEPGIPSARDDLLAELFPVNEPGIIAKKSIVVKDERAQQDDLLAELFPVEPTKPPLTSPIIPHSAMAEASLDLADPAIPLTEKKAQTTKPPGAASARDSLLEDLLDSPPRQRRGARAPEENEDVAAKREPSLPVSPGPGPSSPRKESPIKPEPPPTIKMEPSLPSPGKAKTLTLGTPSKVREVEFEQSKDDLLEEILSSAPASPLKPNENVASSSPRSRHSSLSVSLDQEANAGASHPSEPPPAPVVPATRRRPSRSPEKEPQTVFLRDVHAEEELKRSHVAEVAALRERHAGEVRQQESELQHLQSRMEDEQRKLESQINLCESHTLQLQHLQDQLLAARAEYAALSSDFQALQTRHSAQQTQFELVDREKTVLLGQLKSADEQQRAVVSQLAQEKLARQQAEMELVNFKRETEQKAQLQTEKERAQMDRLYHQLQNTLVQLTMLQEQNSEDLSARRELEAASRFRMIASLESTSRGYAQQTQDECHRLSSLLSNLETTLRAYRQEHVEEKERLRQEQMRLTVLAQYFQAQTSVLHEKSDANAQLLAQHLNASLQDARVAEARLAARRQQLADDEQKLYGERAAFASHREEWVEQRQRDVAQLEAQRIALDREWRDLQREREDLEDVIASHEDAFRAMQRQQQTLDAEKERVAVGALHVADMAAKFELLTKQLVDKEQAMRDQQLAVEEMRRDWATREKVVETERLKLGEREGRLHAQLKQMETARRKLNEERKQQLQRIRDSRATDSTTMGAVRSHVTLGSGGKPCLEARTTPLTPHATPQPCSFSTPAQIAPILEPSKLLPRPTYIKTTNYPVMSTKLSSADPSGLSPAFRQLIEDNWRKPSHQTTTELLKERVEIHCLGLNTSPSDKTIHVSKQQVSSHSIMPTTSKAPGIGASRRREAPQPPPEPRSPQPRILSVHL